MYTAKKILMSAIFAFLMLISFGNAQATKIPIIELNGKPLHLVVSSDPDLSDEWNDKFENEVWQALPLRVSGAIVSNFYDAGVQIHPTAYTDRQIPARLRKLMLRSQITDLIKKHNAFGVLILRIEKTENQRIAQFVAELKVLETISHTFTQAQADNAKELNQVLGAELVKIIPNKEKKGQVLSENSILTARAETTFQQALDLNTADQLSEMLLSNLLEFLGEKHSLHLTTLN